jgi:hypothetical protein
LRPDNGDITTQLLARILLQSSNASDTSLNDIKTLIEPITPFQASAYAVRLNTVWFLSLILALAAALFSLIVKQWVREYLKWTLVSHSRDAVVLRQSRYDALDRWLVLRVIGGLPIIVQSAVILFLAGLIDFLWHLDTTLALISTVMVVLCLISATGSALMPSFYRHCPYKSPLAWVALEITSAIKLRVKRAFRGLRRINSPRIFHHIPAAEDLDPFESWRREEMRGLEVRTQFGSYYERQALAWARKSSVDDKELDGLVLCLRGMGNSGDAVSCLFDIFAHDLRLKPAHFRALITRNDQYGLLRGSRLLPAPKDVVLRQFKMTATVVDRIWDTWDFSALLDVMLLLRALWIVEVTSLDDEFLGCLARKCIAIYTRRLELHSTSLADRLLQTTAWCLNELFNRTFQANIKNSVSVEGKLPPPQIFVNPR